MVQKSDIDDRFRENLIRLRNAKGLSQSELSKIAGLPHLAQIESGATNAGKNVIAKLADALKVDISEFYIPPNKAEHVKKRTEILLSLFRSCSHGGQSIILAVAKLINRYEKRQTKKF